MRSFLALIGNDCFGSQTAERRQYGQHFSQSGKMRIQMMFIQVTVASFSASSGQQAER
jgi:hypothetical protein